MEEYQNQNTTAVIAELDALYLRGWRGPVFFVDDNSLGIREIEKRHFPAIVEWNEKEKPRFTLVRKCQSILR